MAFGIGNFSGNFQDDLGRMLRNLQDNQRLTTSGLTSVRRYDPSLFSSFRPNLPQTGPLNIPLASPNFLRGFGLDANTANNIVNNPQFSDFFAGRSSQSPDLSSFVNQDLVDASRRQFARRQDILQNQIQIGQQRRAAAANATQGGLSNQVPGQGQIPGQNNVMGPQSIANQQLPGGQAGGGNAGQIQSSRSPFDPLAITLGGGRPGGQPGANQMPTGGLGGGGFWAGIEGISPGHLQSMQDAAAASGTRLPGGQAGAGGGAAQIPGGQPMGRPALAGRGSVGDQESLALQAAISRNRQALGLTADDTREMLRQGGQRPGGMTFQQLNEALLQQLGGGQAQLPGGRVIGGGGEPFNFQIPQPGEIAFDPLTGAQTTSSASSSGDQRLREHLANRRPFGEQRIGPTLSDTITGGGIMAQGIANPTRIVGQNNVPGGFNVTQIGAHQNIGGPGSIDAMRRRGQQAPVQASVANPAVTVRMPDGSIVNLPPGAERPSRSKVISTRTSGFFDQDGQRVDPASFAIGGGGIAGFGSGGGGIAGFGSGGGGQNSQILQLLQSAIGQQGQTSAATLAFQQQALQAQQQAMEEANQRGIRQQGRVRDILTSTMMDPLEQLIRSRSRSLLTEDQDLASQPLIDDLTARARETDLLAPTDPRIGSQLFQGVQQAGLDLLGNPPENQAQDIFSELASGIQRQRSQALEDLRARNTSRFGLNAAGPAMASERRLEENTIGALADAASRTALQESLRQRGERRADIGLGSQLAGLDLSEAGRFRQQEIQGLGAAGDIARLGLGAEETELNQLLASLSNAQTTAGRRAGLATNLADFESQIQFLPPFLPGIGLLGGSNDLSLNLNLLSGLGGGAGGLTAARVSAGPTGNLPIGGGAPNGNRNAPNLAGGGNAFQPTFNQPFFPGSNEGHPTSGSAAGIGPNHRLIKADGTVAGGWESGPAPPNWQNTVPRGWFYEERNVGVDTDAIIREQLRRATASVA